MTVNYLIYSLLVLVIWLSIFYFFYLYRHSCHSKRLIKQTFRVFIIIGSGGHTTEMLSVIQHLGERYVKRIYILAVNDKLSEQKVKEFEKSRANGSFHFERITRSREVLQSYFSSVFTTLCAIYDSMIILWRWRPDLIICNGPGTCIPVCSAAFVLDLFRLLDIRIFFIESICRVKRLSMTGLLLYYSRMADFIAVQWKDLAAKYPRSTHINDL